jgi:PEP-CTERM motif
VSLDPADIGAGRAVSNAVLTPSGPNIGVGAMSAAYGGSGSAVTYEATAVFDFSTTKSEALDLKLLSDNFADNPAGIAFDSLDLQVVVDGTTRKNLPFSSLTGSSGAEEFFNADSISLGTIGAGSQSIEIEYFVGYNSGTSALVGDGFGFTYEFVNPPLTNGLGFAAAYGAIPEPSTWAMMVLGFAGLGLAGYRARRAATSIE